MKGDVLIRIRGLKKYFPTKKGIIPKVLGRSQWVRAVDDVNLDILEGKTLGLVGESGSGKSTTGLLIMGLLKPTEGRVFIEGKNIFELNAKELKNVRKKMGIIFQDPYQSLNPRMTVKDIVGLPVKVHHPELNDRERTEKVVSILEKVGLKAEDVTKYPHEFSGGQRQRIAIARALILNPKFIMLDEPTSALDLSVQATILNLLLDLQQEFNLTYLFISHDIGVIEYISDEIAVMYLGKIVEQAPTDTLFEAPMHPYTKALLSAVPPPDPDVKKERITLKGSIPDPINPPSGCSFHTRCPVATQICSEEAPRCVDVGKRHLVTCHRYGEADSIWG